MLTPLTNKLKALLIGYVYELTLAPVPILVEAGFSIDVICTECQNLSSEKFKTIAIDNDSLIFTALDCARKNHYDLIIIGDDQCIADVLDSEMSADEKLKLLPVTSKEHFQHLYSKCQLSNTFQDAVIPTPNFLICETKDELLDKVNHLKFPLFIKIDRSGGGMGVFECESADDVYLKTNSLGYPVLIQEKINGETVDLSAFYHQSKLIYFSYSTFFKSIGSSLGPSSVRRYRQISDLPENIYSELQDIGDALGANGFVSITCIEESHTGKRFYIEADMRPNAWINYGKYIGNDAGMYLKKYFQNGDLVNLPIDIDPRFPRAMLVGFADRLAVWEVAFNRYGVWKTFPNFHSLYTHIHFRLDYEIKKFSRQYLQPFLHPKIWSVSREIYKKIYLLIEFENLIYSNIQYKATLRFKVLCSKYVKPFISTRIWDFLKSKFR